MSDVTQPKDAMGHVNHAKYLTFSQEARFAMLGMFNMVVARIEADYKAPIALGNIFIDVTMWVESIGTSSFKLVYEIGFWILKFKLRKRIGKV